MKNRTPMVPLRRSSHMLECRAIVLAKFPDAVIVGAGKQMWKLQSDGDDLSNAHNSDYACWFEARKILEQIA